MTDREHTDRIRTGRIRTQPDGTYTVLVTVTAEVLRPVEEPARLSMSCQWIGEPTVSHVAIALTEVAENRTEVVVTHSANTSRTDSDDHLHGWRDCLGRLVETYGTAES